MRPRALPRERRRSRERGQTDQGDGQRADQEAAARAAEYWIDLSEPSGRLRGPPRRGRRAQGPGRRRRDGEPQARELHRQHRRRDGRRRPRPHDPRPAGSREEIQGEARSRGRAGRRVVKIRVGVLTGGASAERDISLATGAQIAASLDPSRFEVVLLDPLAFMARNPEITAEQREQAQRLIKGGGRLESDHQLPRGLEKQIESASRALVPATRVMTNNEPIDVVLIALHGTWGEDGRIQGLLDTIGVPYTGSGVLASALAMDKEVAKTVLAAAGLDVPRGVVVTGTTEQDLDAARSVGIPAFVKPVSSGSSVGASIVAHAADLPAAIALALRYDSRALVEEQLKGRELTVPVIGNDDLTALPVIEILTKRAFFDYSAKYDAGESEEVCPAEIPPEVAKRAQDLAVRAHRALRCRGMSRTDFVWSGDRMVALEVNTIPGMTANSLLPKAARAAGIGFGDLLARFIDWALEDARRRAR
ncbi:MAG: D-alanine--D-alanine ligase [Chloroflexi bacterium]|nr:MAG: D-alanine--D-alanine ligase [Chloroflexota bacterium]